MYNKNLIKKAQTFLANKNVELYIGSDAYTNEFAISVDVNNERIWTDGDGFWSTVKKGVKVNYVNLLMTKDVEEEEWNGGLSGTISYDGSGKDGTWYDGSDVDSRLINKIKNEQDSDGMIYGNTAFINNTFKYMVEHCDFDMDLEKYLWFDYSEQGMQDDENVNLDVELDVDFWQHVFNLCKQQNISVRVLDNDNINYNVA
jgi:hypothetical protein